MSQPKPKSPRKPKTLVQIVGPPAVGKMAVGRALERLTGLPLLHNHMTIELVLPFFPFGSPSFRRLVADFRRSILNAVANGDGPGMIFTGVWDFARPEDQDFAEELVGIFTAQGGRSVFVELYADLEIRLARNSTPLRLLEKPSKRDIESSNARLLKNEELHTMNSTGAFPFPDHIKLDTGVLEPDEAARVIAEAFQL